MSQSFLAVELDGDVIRTIPLAFEVLTIGRAPDNSLSLQHPHVGRHHLELRLTPDGLIITDLGSVNGTFVDEVRLLPHQPTSLDASQSLRVGPFILAARRVPIDTEDAEFEPVATEPVAHGAERNGQAAPAPIDFERALARRAAGKRPSSAPTRPVETVSRYLEYLPSIFAENDFLGRFLLIFESVWEPLESRQDHMHMYVDPATCPASFLAWLASWFDMETGSHWPEDRVRDMIGQAMDLYQWRGTAYGMARIVELWTGIHPRIEESPREPFVFNVRMRSEPDRPIDRRMVEDLLRTHKPAHAGFVLEIES